MLPLNDSEAMHRLDLVLRAVYYAWKCRDVEIWHYAFGHCSPPLHSRCSKTVETLVANQRIIFTSDPENIRAILASQFQDYGPPGKGQVFHEDWKDFLGDGIFNVDGQAWHDARSLLRPLFAKTEISQLEIFEKHTQELISLIGREGQEIDISDLFYKLTLDTATDFLLGRSVDSLICADSSFAKAFNEILRVQRLKFIAGPLKWFVPRGGFRRALDTIDSFIEPFIQDTLRLTSKELNDRAVIDENHTFLQSLARYTKDPKVIRDQLINIILAGRDTTAGTLSFLFKELSANPAIYTKLRHEILSRLGPHTVPTFNDLNNLPYLHNTINETLRLYPSVPTNVRVSLNNVTLPRGGGADGLSPIGILKDTYVVYSPLYLQREDSTQYPPPSTHFPDLKTFCPERWERWAPRQWQYIPFNAGPRVCIGQGFAKTEIAYTVVRMVQRFEGLERRWTDEEGGMKGEIVLSPRGGVRVGFWVGGGGEEGEKV
ncbi:MAG: hypothetical protein LQ338_004008 [Usnochroma carphineum]|nr:MAG: hypothetical protein LQ338_004008 [Usnochroma carphineum]